MYFKGFGDPFFHIEPIWSSAHRQHDARKRRATGSSLRSLAPPHRRARIRFDDSCNDGSPNMNAFGKFSSSHSRMSEDEKGIRISIDLPGVKDSDMTVEFQENVLRISGKRSDKSTTTEFQRAFAINGDVIDTTKLKANLSDGVLIITAPRKPEQERPTQIIPVVGGAEDDASLDKAMSTEESDSENGNDQNVHFTIDLPGCKAKDVKVELHDHGKVLHVSGRRTIEPSSDFERKFVFDANSVNTSKLRARLLDGVLVLKAPKSDKPTPLSVSISSGPHNDEEYETVDLTESSPSKEKKVKEETEASKDNDANTSDERIPKKDNVTQPNDARIETVENGDEGE